MVSKNTYSWLILCILGLLFTGSENQHLLADDSEHAGILFHTAYTAFLNGHAEDAVRLFQQCAKAYPDNPLMDYVELYTALSLMKVEEYERARETLQHIRAAYPNSLLLAEARFLEADTYYYQQQWASAIQHYLVLKQDKSLKKHRLMPELYLKLGHCYEQLAQFKAALDTYHQTRFSFITSPIYTQAKAHEERLLRQYPPRTQLIPPDKQIKDAEKLIASGRAADGIAIITPLLTGKLSAELKEKALLLSARAHYVLRANHQALELYGRILEEFPKSKAIPGIWDSIARLHLRQKNMDAFLEIYNYLVKQYPTHATTAAVTRLKGKEFGEQGKFEEALEVYSVFMTTFPKSPLVPEILWYIGWSNYQLQRYEDALKAFSRLARAYPKSELCAETLYWAGRSSEHLQQYAHAGDYYIQAVNTQPNSYYGDLSRQAFNRIQQEHPKLTFSQEFATTKPFPIIASDPVTLSAKRGQLHWKKADMLRQAQLYELAAEEFADALEYEKKPGPAHYLELARLYQQAGNYHQLYKLVHTEFSYWILRGGVDLPDAFWQLAYPLAFWENIQAHADDDLPDPFLVLSMMLAESGFDPEAYAPDGGRGLMQLMPATGARLAESLELDPPALDAYFQPDTNILLGATYLKQLLSLFGQQLPPAIASYNAGEDTVAAWWKDTYKTDIPAFVASIPYPVTKRYIQRVLWHYHEYQRIYRPF